MCVQRRQRLLAQSPGSPIARPLLIHVRLGSEITHYEITCISNSLISYILETEVYIATLDSESCYTSVSGM